MKNRLKNFHNSKFITSHNFFHNIMKSIMPLWQSFYLEMEFYIFSFHKALYTLSISVYENLGKGKSLFFHYNRNEIPFSSMEVRELKYIFGFSASTLPCLIIHILIVDSGGCEIMRIKRIWGLLLGTRKDYYWVSQAYQS